MDNNLHVANFKNCPVKITHETMDKNSEINKNWHEDIEIVFVLEGCAKINYDNEIIYINKNEICIINPYTIHRISTNEYCNCLIYSLNTKLCSLYGLELDSFRYRKYSNSSKLRHLLEVMHKEYTSQRLYSDIFITGVAFQLATYLVRHMCAYSITHNDKQGKRRENINFALGYIKSNFMRKITLDDICQELNINKSYFSREFKHFTNMTVVNYINTIRCEYAQQLLSDGKMSISEISEKCGFDTLQYFSTVFKKHVGISPAAYAKQYQ